MSEGFLGGRLGMVWLVAWAGLLGLGCGDDSADAAASGAQPQAQQPPPGPNFGNADGSVSPTGRLVDAGPLTDAEAALLDPCRRVEVRNLDLLFMVDNSASMREEQEALSREFPRLVRALTTGDRDGDGRLDFPPIENLHLGVVSSDMGLVGVQGIPNCTGLGDDGIMNDLPSPAVQGCQAAYPRFLGYSADSDDPDQLVTDFACLSTLGTEGCGFEQQLEATLKALWPSVDFDPTTGEVHDPNRILFLGDLNGLGQLGHGDVEHAGFLRAVEDGASVLGIVIVSDEEDCSSQNTRHFTPEIYLDPDDPLRAQDLNLRCFHNPQNLYSLERYVQGFKALRPGLEQLVVYAAIVGVPPDLVSADALQSVDFSDPAARDAHYESILADERMQEMPDPDRSIEQGGNLLPSCRSESGVAYPPRRFVQLAQQFGQNATVQSICHDDFGPAIDGIVDAIGRTVDRACIVE